MFLVVIYCLNRSLRTISLAISFPGFASTLSQSFVVDCSIVSFDKVHCVLKIFLCLPLLSLFHLSFHFFKFSLLVILFVSCSLSVHSIDCFHTNVVVDHTLSRISLKHDSHRRVFGNTDPFSSVRYHYQTLSTRNPLVFLSVPHRGVSVTLEIDYRTTISRSKTIPYWRNIVSLKVSLCMYEPLPRVRTRVLLSPPDLYVGTSPERSVNPLFVFYLFKHHSRRVATFIFISCLM